MLMLVVTIIIAAVVSGFAGGLINSQEATPSATFDVSLTDDSIDLKVQSISEDISSKDLMIVLSKAGQTRKLVPGASTIPFGFNIVEWEDVKGFHDNEEVGTEGISQTQAAHVNNTKQWFGNYTLTTGSRMSASGDAFATAVAGIEGIPEGFTKATYTKGEFYDISADMWQSVFGDTLTDQDLGSDSNVLKIKSNAQITNPSLQAYFDSKGFLDTDNTPTVDLWAEASDTNWQFGQTIVYGDGHGSISVSPGNSVTVTIVHSPSGQTMFMKTVTVKEA
jgi:FlaG/FlaF family flagellin (archaellin)